MNIIQLGLIDRIGVGVKEWGMVMFNKIYITLMSDLFDYLPKSLCRVSETDEFIETNFSLIYPQLEIFKRCKWSEGLKEKSIWRPNLQ